MILVGIELFAGVISDRGAVLHNELAVCNSLVQHRPCACKENKCVVVSDSTGVDVQRNACLILVSVNEVLTLCNTNRERVECYIVVN